MNVLVATNACAPVLARKTAIAHRYLKDANTDYKPRVKELVVLALDRLTR